MLCGVRWTCAFLDVVFFLIKIVPLGGNWCSLRLGRSRMGGDREVRLRWYRVCGDRKPLCNLVRLEIGAAIKPAALNCTCAFCTAASQAVCWTAVNSSYLCWWLLPESGSISALYVKGAQCYDHMQRESEGINGWLSELQGRRHQSKSNMWRQVVTLWEQKLQLD